MQTLLTHIARSTNASEDHITIKLCDINLFGAHQYLLARELPAPYGSEEAEPVALVISDARDAAAAFLDLILFTESPNKRPLREFLAGVGKVGQTSKRSI